MRTNPRMACWPCFQFIGFPSEWGVVVLGNYDLQYLKCFQFIGFPSEWGADADKSKDGLLAMFPIYWVPQRVGRPFPKDKGELVFFVSNLLGSPASGEGLGYGLVGQFFGKFPIYWVPQRVGSPCPLGPQPQYESGFQFIGFPSEWGAYLVKFPSEWDEFKFPIYWVPQRVGRVRCCGMSPSSVTVVSNLLGSPASGEE